jgi:hypothetical protein
LGGKGDAVRGRKVSRQEFERDYEPEGEGHSQQRQQPSEPSDSGLPRTMIQSWPPILDTATPVVRNTAALNNPTGRGELQAAWTLSNGLSGTS